MGTSTHFAPEYCKWALSPDNTRFETTPAAELHAVGYMFYELLTGRGPFPFATNEVELIRTIITMDRGNGLKTPSELNPSLREGARRGRHATSGETAGEALPEW